MSIQLKPIAGQFLHLCEFADGRLIDEYDNDILKCRCFESQEFLAAQDKRAVEIDLQRGQV